MRPYLTLKALLNGEVIDLDGIKLIMDNGSINRGDLYVAERNTGPKLLTAERINVDWGFIVPTTMNYAYDTRECVKVREA